MYYILKTIYKGHTFIGHRDSSNYKYVAAAVYVNDLDRVKTLCKTTINISLKIFATTRYIYVVKFYGNLAF